MKTCYNCRNQITDEAVYCPVCGSAVDAAPGYVQQDPPFNPVFSQNPSAVVPQPYMNPYDHTKDFDTADISENKVVSMLIYLLGPVGIIIALLSATDSAYTRFHVKEAMKLTVTEVLAVTVLAAMSFVLWSIRLRAFMFFVIALAALLLAMIHFVCFILVCMGKAKEVPFVRLLPFLK